MIEADEKKMKQRGMSAYNNNGKKKE